ncbi:hypothetical protein C9413_32795, partial [Rhizobium sp. SEMIA 4085]|nr:hypothetical protein [Rhizobium sp. SEMIA 4085]
RGAGGLRMGACQFPGAQVGPRLAVPPGPKLNKPLLVTVCIAFTVKLLSDPTNPLRLWSLAMAFDYLPGN